MQKRDVLSSPKLLELKTKRRNTFIRKIAFFVCGIFIVLGALAYLSSLSYISIKNIEVAGNKVVESKSIQRVAEVQIAGKYLWLFSRKNVLLYPKKKIESALASDFKRLTDIELKIKDSNVLEISVSERTPVFSWCGTELPADVQVEKCYFLDNEGYIFDEAPYFSGQVYFKFYGPYEGDAPAGSYFRKEKFKHLVEFKEALDTFGLKPKALFIDDAGSAKVLLPKGKSAYKDPEILFKIDTDLGNIAENLKAALDAEPLKSKIKNFYSTLLYIDLRFDNKVYYKF